MARKMVELRNGFNFKTVVVLYWIEISYQNIDKSCFRRIASAHKLRGVRNDARGLNSHYYAHGDGLML
jgi:hypothetical protein